MDTWQEEAAERIEEIRKGDFTLTILMPNGQPASGMAIYIKQTRHDFCFGTCVSAQYLGGESEDSKKYEDFILKHFNTIVFENELKWEFTEPEQGKENFSEAGKIWAFAQKNHLRVRGNCLLWGVPSHIQAWVRHLSPENLKESMLRHLQNTVSRYAGRLIAWDVFNELLDGAYYADVLGEQNLYEFFQKVKSMDPHTPLFLNEYGILDNEEKQGRYLQLVQRLQRNGVEIGGLGIQEHAAERFSFGASGLLFSTDAQTVPFLPEDVLRCWDYLGTSRLPIYMTELSFRSPNEERKAAALETCFRLAFSHPNIRGIILWGFWENNHWLGKDAALVNADWQCLPAGNILRKLLLEEWNTSTTEIADEKGEIKFRGFFGDYRIEGQLPSGEKITGETKCLASQRSARVMLSFAQEEEKKTTPVAQEETIQTVPEKTN